jgi:hypothetical protein
VVRSYVYSFSLNLPTDFAQTSERLVLAQWRQLCEAEHCEPDRPIMSANNQTERRAEDNSLSRSREGHEDVRGKGLDFRIAVHFSSAADGSIEATLNRPSIVEYQGPTLFKPRPGYPVRGLIYFKTGLYPDALQRSPWTIYVGEYRKDQCSSVSCG